METSIHLAKVIGLFGTISTLTIILRYKFNQTMEENAARNPTTIYLSGFVFLLLGVLIIVKHPEWPTNWTVLITIFGWMLLLKGILRILFPEHVKNLIERKKTETRFLLAEIITLLLSIYLLYKGFFNTSI